MKDYFMEEPPWASPLTGRSGLGHGHGGSGGGSSGSVDMVMTPTSVPNSTRVAAAADMGIVKASAEACGFAVLEALRTVALVVLGAELAYILLDRAGKWAARHQEKAQVPARIRASLAYAYGIIRWRARKYYWKTHNELQRLAKEWGETDDEWGSGLLVCILLPFVVAFLLRVASTLLLPAAGLLLCAAARAATALVAAHWKVGSLLAQGLGGAASLTLPAPFDLLALAGTAVLLAGREHARHIKGDSFLALCRRGLAQRWSRRGVVALRLRRVGTRLLRRPLVQRLRAQLVELGGSARHLQCRLQQASQAWAALLRDGLLQLSGLASQGGGGGGARAGDGSLITLESLEKAWPTIAHFPVRRAGGQCGICHDRHVVLFAMSATCRHAFCRGCVAEYMHSLLASGPFPARCPSCRVEEPAPANPQSAPGLVTRSVAKALAAEGVVTPHHARRFVLQQCRAVADESTQDVIARTSKRCPSCGQHTTHYKNHGCHHIKPGTGCPSCGTHWCFVCLYDSGLTWTGCSNECRLYCDDTCSCPKCPDCQPGLPCEACDRDCPSCRLHA